jgi:ZIP family zinc transporter
MLALSLAAYKLEVPVLIVAAMQHLAAGIVLSAMAVELVPIISAAPQDLPCTIGITSGFIGGIGLFLLLGNFCEGPEEQDDERTPLLQSPADTLARQASGRQEPPVLLKKRSLAKLARVEADAVPEKGKGASKVPYPYVLVLAVITDSLVDGFLIGITAVSGHTAGLVMSLALSVEMGFLGLTFATTMRKQQPLVGIVSVLIPPVCLALGGVIGALLAGVMASSPPLHVALISFGMAALLYLVTEELLLEAHESLEKDGLGHVWWVDLCFFLGFLASFLLEKAAD